MASTAATERATEQAWAHPDTPRDIWDLLDQDDADWQKFYPARRIAQARKLRRKF